MPTGDASRIRSYDDCAARPKILRFVFVVRREPCQNIVPFAEAYRLAQSVLWVRDAEVIQEEPEQLTADLDEGKALGRFAS